LPFFIYTHIHIHTYIHTYTHMNNLGHKQTFTLGNQEITLETGILAKQSDGAVVVRVGNTMMLATVVSNPDANPGVDFMPLTVEYREKFSAAGKFPGGFIKRENRPSDSEILVSRLVDRALRPLFPEDYHGETQMLIWLISLDKQINPDAYACLAASAAIAVSDIPFQEPISEARVARINGEFVINPSKDQLALADIDIMVAATKESIIMVEGEMSEVSEEDMLVAITKAHDAIKIQCEMIAALAAKVGKTPREYNHEDKNEELKKQILAFCHDKIYNVAKKALGKKERKEALTEIRNEFVATLSEEMASENEFLIKKYYHDAEKEAIRNLILREGLRLDGRKTTDIRPIWSVVDYLPSTHGSAVFTRGETQSLTSVTLGTKQDAQSVDGVYHEGAEKFMLHYNFPPFSTGEARPMRSTSRREIGHGNLALRALKPVIPTDENENPYTIRVVSDILESNGSSSMATVCAGTLALMDAGIKIKAPVSGIAMGLILNEKGEFAILSDILGDEDHLGDMDFKVTGTAKGITACQMDIKVGGLSYEIMQKALAQAKQGRAHILGEMLKTIDKPNADYKPNAPRIVKLTIPKDMIGAIIGPGGKIIQEIQKETGTVISIEEKDNKGYVEIASENKESIDKALFRIKGIVAQPEVDEIYTGTVKAIQTYGAFVEILPGKDGLLHVSEIDWKRIDNVSDVLKEGDEIQVKLIGIDPKTGKLKLSRKVLLENPHAAAVQTE
jgi:polyribonucleotide nucleotidyltransferase